MLEKSGFLILIRAAFLHFKILRKIFCENVPPARSIFEEFITPDHSTFQHLLIRLMIELSGREMLSIIENEGINSCLIFLVLWSVIEELPDVLLKRT